MIIIKASGSLKANYGDEPALNDVGAVIDFPGNSVSC